jgi:tRNA (guanine-N7-)-methyltransferase
MGDWEVLVNALDGRISNVKDWEMFHEGKGLIGGDPSRRPGGTRPLPEQFPRAFRLLGAAPDKLERLHRFLHDAPLEIEIGSGRGEFILDWAARHPHRRFLAFEVKTKLMLRMAKRAQNRGLENLWVSDDDARYTLPRLLNPASVDVFHILFPDPWWKPKHQARRIFTPPFVDVLALLLRPTGLLRAATDVPGYARHIRELLEAHPDFTGPIPELAERFTAAPPTDRQVFCDEIGRPYEYLYFEKNRTKD